MIWFKYNRKSEYSISIIFLKEISVKVKIQYITHIRTLITLIYYL